MDEFESIRQQDQKVQMALLSMQLEKIKWHDYLSIEYISGPDQEKLRNDLLDEIDVALRMIDKIIPSEEARDLVGKCSLL
jgi:hypothetical protein